MKEIITEIYCRDCDYEGYVEEGIYKCPKCHSDHIQRFHSLKCTCGDIVALGSFTNECPNCGRMYNSFGQELAPVSQWDPEDVYGSFGPQEDW